jgi:hypothetical protein
MGLLLMSSLKISLKLGYLVPALTCKYQIGILLNKDIGSVCKKKQWRIGDSRAGE